MNHFIITKKPNDGAFLQTIRITISPEIAEDVISALKERFTIPLLLGEQNILANGQTELIFKLNDEDASLLKNAFLTAYARQSGYLTTN